MIKDGFNMNKDIRIILASGSPRRRELLRQAGYEYTVAVSDVDEETDTLIPKDYVMQLAERKATDIYNKEWVKCADHKSNTLSHERASEREEPHLDKYIVIGADTVVTLNNRILGKPYDYDDAYNTLNSLSNQTHHVYTGVCIIYFNGETAFTKTFYECTEVTFYPMTHEEIVWYLATKEPFDKAGSYGIQGKGGVFVKEIKGDYNNVVGLPLARLYHELEEIIAK